LGCGVSKGNRIAAFAIKVVSMKRSSLFTALFVLCVAAGGGSARAGDPAGDWLVEDGTAKIRIAICGGSLWGVVGWEKSPGKDTSNPDPAKRTRDTLGMPILLDMKPSGPDKWAGQIYNAKDGKMYQASVELQSDSALKVRGCVLGGLFCGGEVWARSSDASGAAPGFPAPISGTPSKSKSKPKAATPEGGSTLAGSVCSRVGDVPGTTH
jgi:uncharacterized protein (DUF2147 family)